MSTSRLRPGQSTVAERARAREARRASEGCRNLQGGTSRFIQWRGDATPTQEEMESAVQWQRGVEQTGHVAVRFGPDFSRLIPDVPDNTEASGPTPLHVEPRRG